MNEEFEEGTRAITAEDERSVEEVPENVLHIDRRKLIVYSEILKPKFDEGLR